MNYLTTGDLYLALNDLFEKRYTDFLKSKIANAYEPLLQQKRKQLNDLPKVVVSATPLIDQLSQQDTIHDDCIDTILRVTGGVISSPRASAALKKAAKDIRETLNLSPDDKTAAYPQEAFTALQRKEQIGALKGTLQLFSLPEGGTLYDIALDYVAAGEAINRLLSERAKFEALTEEDKRKISTLRPEIIGILGRFRKALPDELAGNENLPRNLISLIFGYFDELHQIRVASNQAAQEAKLKAREAAADQAAKEALLDAAKAQAQADLLAKEAEAAQKKADEAKKKADENP